MVTPLTYRAYSVKSTESGTMVVRVGEGTERSEHSVCFDREHVEVLDTVGGDGCSSEYT